MVQREVTSEFTEKFGRLSSRVRGIMGSQPYEISKKLEQALRDQRGAPILENLEEEDQKVLVATALIATIEEIIPVSIGTAVRDLALYAEVQDIPLEGIGKNQETFADKVEPLFRNLHDAISIFLESSGFLIMRLSAGWEEELVKSFVIVDFWKPMLTRMIKESPKGEETDARLAASIIMFAAKAYFQRRERAKDGEITTTHSIFEEYESIKTMYPEVRGTSFAFDAAWKILSKEIWEEFRGLVQEKIDEHTKAFEEDKAQREAFRRAAIERESEEQSDDRYGAQIEMRLFEVFTQGNPLDEKKRRNLVYSIDVLIRRVLVDATDRAYGSAEETMEVAFPMLWRAMNEHKQLFAPLIDRHGEVPQIARADSWSEWIQEHIEVFEDRFKKYITRKAPSMKSMDIAEAFADLVVEASKTRLPVDFKS